MVSVHHPAWQVQSCFVSRGIFDDDEWSDVNKRVDVRKILGDISVVRGGTGFYMLGMLEKQLSSVGVSTWAEPISQGQKQILT